ncbi:hypothetical protein clem_12790 [Legionella clemsonensis]|uniref:Uncharacterized protein n=1 Tax=Legionella clemsonensis TaxID=1867846 RepID=A0A222P5I2_9GAMM|nr:hypothetical protein clem_12790 [Legionella clemsonensis]
MTFGLGDGIIGVSMATHLQMRSHSVALINLAGLILNLNKMTSFTAELIADFVYQTQRSLLSDRD